MRTYAAAIVGALLATLGLAAWQTRAAAPVMTGFSQAPSAWGGSTAATAAADIGAIRAAAAMPTVVRCAPGQRAIVRQTLVDGQPATATECSWDTAAMPSYAESPGPAGGSDIVEYPRAVPARYVVAQPAPRRAAARRAIEKPKRSWKKTALVIGGSAGAGAGIGALTGGKKGALIGAAIGGGAASIYEAVKRR